MVKYFSENFKENDFNCLGDKAWKMYISNIIINQYLCLSAEFQKTEVKIENKLNITWKF